MEGRFLLSPPEEEDEYQFFLSDFKVACMLLDWMDENEEDSLLSFYSVGPGDLRSRADSAEWLLYSMRELSKQFNPEAGERLSRLLLRIRHGVKEELTDLVKLKGVGRSRARLLFNAGYPDRRTLSEADAENLARLPQMGRSLANSILSQLGRVMAPLPAVMEEEQNDDDGQEARQSRLFDF
jgi:helicase